MKKILASTLILAFVAITAIAQDDLTKEITLDRDFVPVIKKVAKKSSLPQVFKPAKSTFNTDIPYSDWAKATAVGTEIPTMLPYGYRTGHTFNTKRGYVDFGFGSQMNNVLDAGYRLIDDSTFVAGIWLQHFGTSQGKNSTEYNPYDSGKLEPLKQKINDNMLGIDLTKSFKGGTLSVNASGRINKFNYYNDFWRIDTTDQKFTEFHVNADWKGKTNVGNFHNLLYHLGIAFYNGKYKTLGFDDNKNPYDGNKDHNLALKLGAQYTLQSNSEVGIDARFDSYSINLYDFGVNQFNSTSVNNLALKPFYAFRGGKWNIKLGADINFSSGDGAKLRVAPNAQVSTDLATGVTFYGDVKGGKTINTLSRMNNRCRYVYPNNPYASTWTPLDAEAGLKFGPFGGFTARAYAGYGIIKNDPTMMMTTEFSFRGQKVIEYFNTKGIKFGGEATLQIRSFAQLSATLVFAPQDSKASFTPENPSNMGYTLGLDRAETVGNIDLALHPNKNLSVNVGVEYRGGRHYFSIDYIGNYAVYNMNNVTNLHAGVNYNISKNLAVWGKANNLLNKQWDEFIALGAQKFSLMGGITFTF